MPDPALSLRFRFTAYRQAAVTTPHPSEAACKLWITQGRRTVWSVPRDRHSGDDGAIDAYARRSPGWLVELAADYLHPPRTRLLDWPPPWSGWGLVEILRASDRRIGRRQWPRLRAQLREPAAVYLLDLRAGRATPRPPAVGGRDACELHVPD